MDAIPTERKLADGQCEAVTHDLRRYRRLLLILLFGFAAAVLLAQRQSIDSEHARYRAEAQSLADRFIELAIRARMLATVAPDAVGNHAMISNGLFDHGLQRVSAGADIQVRWALLGGESPLLLLQLSGLPERPCAAFAQRLLQRAIVVGVHSLRINDEVFDIGKQRRPSIAAASCTHDNRAALMLTVGNPSPRALAPPTLKV